MLCEWRVSFGVLNELTDDNLIFLLLLLLLLLLTILTLVNLLAVYPFIRATNARTHVILKFIARIARTIANRVKTSARPVNFWVIFIAEPLKVTVKIPKVKHFYNFILIVFELCECTVHTSPPTCLIHCGCFCRCAFASIALTSSC